ncbi:MAG: outer membrane protein assembly factor BamE [Pseudomonadota bacterium]
MAGIDVRGRFAVGLLTVTLLTGCAVTLEDSHGYVPSESDLSNIEVGRDTRDTVSTLIGQPGFESLRTENGWYYVKSDYETFLWREPKEVRREIVAVLYSDAGVVANIERYDLEDGQVVALSRRVTDSNITGISFLRQLIGNLGNFRLQDFIDEN